MDGGAGWRGHPAVRCPAAQLGGGAGVSGWIGNQLWGGRLDRVILEKPICTEVSVRVERGRGDQIHRRKKSKEPGMPGWVGEAG